MNLETAIDIAVEAHKGQKDKAGQPYIYHCYRVMSKVTTEEEKIVAILHGIKDTDLREDVLEDSNLTKDYLIQEGFNEDIVTAIVLVLKTLSELKNI